MKKLKCDRCGTIYTDKKSINMAIQYADTWKRTCEDDGIKARGVLPCPNIRCDGELIPLE